MTLQQFLRHVGSPGICAARSIIGIHQFDKSVDVVALGVAGIGRRHERYLSGVAG